MIRCKLSEEIAICSNGRPPKEVGSNVVVGQDLAENVRERRMRKREEDERVRRGEESERTGRRGEEKRRAPRSRDKKARAGRRKK